MSAGPPPQTAGEGGGGECSGLPPPPLHSLPSSLALSTQTYILMRVSLFGRVGPSWAYIITGPLGWLMGSNPASVIHTKERHGSQCHTYSVKHSVQIIIENDIILPIYSI